MMQMKISEADKELKEEPHFENLKVTSELKLLKQKLLKPLKRLIRQVLKFLRQMFSETSHQYSMTGKDLEPTGFSFQKRRKAYKTCRQYCFQY